MTLFFAPPVAPGGDAVHHKAAASGNINAVGSAIQVLADILEGSAKYDKVLVRARGWRRQVFRPCQDGFRSTGSPQV